MTDGPRHEITRLEQLVYVELEHGNGGMMLGVSEEGFSFRAVTPINDSGTIHFAFLIDGTQKLEGLGTIEWVQEGGKVAGIQFTDVNPDFERSLGRWLARLKDPLRPPQRTEIAAGRRDPENDGDEGHPPTDAPPATDPVQGAPADDISPSFNLPAAINVQPNRGVPQMFAPWEMTEEASGPQSGNKTLAIVGILGLVALAIFLFFYHEQVGRSLIALGQKLSVVQEKQPAANSVAAPTTTTPATTTPATPSPVVNPNPTAIEEKTPRAAQIRPKVVEPKQRAAATPPSRTMKKANPVPVSPGIAPHSQSGTEQVQTLWAGVSQGNTDAEVALARLYLIGKGVTKSCEQAKVLLSVAAKKGNVEAIDKLSQLKRQGCP